MMIWDCGYGCNHEYPDDWQFGPNGNDPRADWRYQAASYIYLDSELDGVWQTMVPMCDEEALDNFTSVRDIEMPDGITVQYIMVRRPGEGKPHLLPFKYDASNDTVYPMKAEAPQ